MSLLVSTSTLFGECEMYDRYPMNKNTSFVCNVCIMYPLYIAGIIFSDCYILGLMLPIKLLADKNSKYVWPKDECQKFHVMEKMGKIEQK